MTQNIQIRQGLFDEDINVYHGTKAISSTLFRTYLKSAWRFNYEWEHWERLRNQQADKSETFKIGSAFHCMILEPDQYENRFVVAPTFDRRTKVGKEGLEQFQSMHAGKEILSSGDTDMLMQMKKSFERSPLALSILENTQREKSARVKLSNGLYVQCRPDAIKHSHIIDIKTCADATKFRYDIRGHGYYIQAAYYWWLLSQIKRDEFSEADFYFVAVEKNPPYEVSIHAIRNATLSRLAEETIKPGLINLGKFIQEPIYEEEIQWWEMS